MRSNGSHLNVKNAIYPFLFEVDLKPTWLEFTKRKNKPRNVRFARKNSLASPITTELFTCKKIYILNYRLINFWTSRNSRNYDCEICFKKFGKRSGLNRHVLTVHEKQKNFNCTLCHKAFGEKGQLTKHLKTHSLVKDAASCSICKENFKDFKEHYETMHADLKHNCENCYKKFTKLTQLKAHIRTIHGTFGTFFCDFCKKKFAEKFQLRRHMKVHEESQLEQIFLKDEPVDEFERIGIVSEFEVIDEGRRRRRRKINDEKVVCNHCDKSFKSQKRLQDHLDDIHFLINEKIDDFDEGGEEEIKTAKKVEKSTTFQCDQCEKSFGKMQHLRNHFQASHSGNAFTCDNCQRSFSYKSALDRHLKIVHQKIHDCSKCKLKFNSNFDLNKHQELHDESTEIERTCGICKTIFSKERNLNIHVQAIHKNTKFECEICLKVFSFKSAKERHLKVVHYNVKSHQCSNCERSFGTKYDLRNHFDHHHKEDNTPGRYHCEKCDKDFLSSSALSRHQKGVHEHVKIKSGSNFKCKNCHEIFSNRYQKDKHMAQVHLDNTKLKRTCKFCELDFQFYDEFKIHIESHTDIFICITCGEYFKDQESLFTHSERHKKIEIQLRKYTCDICDHRLFNKIQLIVHMRKHMQEKNFYVCEFCGQSYKFIAPFLYHKKLHEGTKEFVCSFCSKEFVRKQDLVAHYKQHTKKNVCDDKKKHL